jgi:hypothetical protein
MSITDRVISELLVTKPDVPASAAVVRKKRVAIRQGKRRWSVFMLCGLTLHGPEKFLLSITHFMVIQKEISMENHEIRWM